MCSMTDHDSNFDPMDLVNRLRAVPSGLGLRGIPLVRWEVERYEAAAEIERLRATVKKLAEVAEILRESSEHATGCAGNPDWRTPGTGCPCGMFAVFARFGDAMSQAVRG